MRNRTSHGFWLHVGHTRWLEGSSDRIRGDSVNCLDRDRAPEVDFYLKGATVTKDWPAILVTKSLQGAPLKLL